MSLATIRVLAGAKGPMALRLRLSRSTDDENPPDYTLVTSVRLELRATTKGAIIMELVTTTFENVLTESMDAIYEFADDGSDVEDPKTYLVQPWITETGIGGSGERPIQEFNLVVTRTP